MLFKCYDCYHTAPYPYFLVLQISLSQHYDNIIFLIIFFLCHLFISFYYCVYLEDCYVLSLSTSKTAFIFGKLHPKID